MARSNGGIIGKTNQTSFGKCTVTSFTSSGSVTTQSGTRLAKILVVAGGGGGANQGGGGGAGGTRNIEVPICGNTPYSATIGAGGAGATAPNSYTASSGAGSSFGCYSSSGGGNGGGWPSPKFAGTGGSGGGGNGLYAPRPGIAPESNLGGAGNSGSYTPPEGNSGGDGYSPGPPAFVGASGGGGGASSAGAASTNDRIAGNGGDGITISGCYPGVPVSAVGGGGGGGANAASPSTGGTGGLGGGGPGGSQQTGPISSRNRSIRRWWFRNSNSKRIKQSKWCMEFKKSKTGLE
jgi:hypothetical protein